MASALVLGGGFGGLAAAHELRRLLPADSTITLVAASDRFFVGYAKLWDLVGIRPLEHGTGRLTGLAARGIRFVRAEITTIDPHRRAVRTGEGRFEADQMLVALGSAPQMEFAGSPDRSAFDLYQAAALPAMRAGVEQLDAGRVIIAVTGLPYVCPPAPYEAAFLLDQRLRDRGVRDRVRVTVITPMPATLPMAGQAISDRVARALAGRGIELLVGHRVSGVDTATRTVALDDGERLDYTLFLAVPQAVPPRVVADSPLAGEGGWIWPDRETGRTAFDGVYAVGDCTAVDNLPRAGVFAEALGRVAAANMAAELTGGSPARYDGTGYCFLEFPGRRAAALEGRFFADPQPVLQMADPSTEGFSHKQSFEAERLQQWLGAP